MVSGQTPMTHIKMYAIIGVLCFVCVYSVYTFYWAPAHPAPVVRPSYFSGQVVEGSGFVQVNYRPIAEASAATPGPTVTPIPTATPAPVSPTPEPTNLPDGNIQGGSVIYVRGPTPTPAPVIHAANSKYIDNWNYFKTRGLYLEYDLRKNVQVKAGSQYKFNASLQNLGASMDHVVASMTVTTLNDDPNLNILLFTVPVLDDRRTVGQYETISIDKSITVPNYKGHFKLYVTFTANNGGSAEIMQEITVV